jgi:hypothetical protein
MIFARTEIAAGLPKPTLHAVDGIWEVIAILKEVFLTPWSGLIIASTKRVHFGGG